MIEIEEEMVMTREILDSNSSRSVGCLSNS